MAKGKPKKKAKAKATPKPKAKTKAKAKPKSKAKPKAKAKPKTKTMAKAKAKSGNGPNPVTVYPHICNPFTANTGDTVSWQGVPGTGCEIEQSGTWPFNVGPPIHLPSPSTIKVSAGTGIYQINVKCCTGEGMKTVTVP